MRKPKPKYYTAEEFFDFVGQHEEFFEYRHGEILAMSAPSPEHEDIGDAIADALNSQFRGRCEARVKRYVATPADTYRIPDVVVWCGERQYKTTRNSKVIANPVMVVEVVSPSTEKIDYGEKLAEYKAIPSLYYYVIAEQDRPEVTVWSRHGDFWRKSEFQTIDDVIKFDELHVSLRLSEFYK